MADTRDDIIEDIPLLRLELLAQVGDLQDVMRSKDIPFGLVENEMLSSTLQLRPDERQVAGLRRLIARLHTMVTRHDNADSIAAAPVKAQRVSQVSASPVSVSVSGSPMTASAVSSISQLSVSGSPMSRAMTASADSVSGSSPMEACLHVPKRRRTERRTLPESAARHDDAGTADSPFVRKIDPRIRSQMESFVRFAIPHIVSLASCRRRRLAMDELIEDYKASLPDGADLPNVHAFFKSNYITMHELKNAAKNVDSVDAIEQGLASIGKNKINYSSMSLQRSLELRPECPCIKWCMEFCTRNATRERRLTRPMLEAAWKQAPQYDAERSQMNTLFSQGVLNMQKINTFANSLLRHPADAESATKRRQRRGNSGHRESDESGGGPGAAGRRDSEISEAPDARLPSARKAASLARKNLTRPFAALCVAETGSI